MRLFDKVLTQCRGEVADGVRGLSKVTSVLACDDIASYYAGSPDVLWDSEKYPHAKPAWDTFFMEWNEPAEYRIGSDVVKNDGVQQFGFFGTHVTSKEDVQSAIDARLQRDVCLFTNRSFSATDVEAARTKTASLIYAFPFIVIGGACHQLPVSFLAFLSESGWVYLHICPTDLPDVSTKAIALGRIVVNSAHIMLLAFTFLNCSNVKLEDVTADLEPPPKIKRRLRIPDVKRYTLNINGHFSKPRRELGEPGEIDVMPFHLCRGHFATYTDAAPLFGKYTGRFWIPPHTKGKKENGVIEKDYAIVN